MVSAQWMWAAAFLSPVIPLGLTWRKLVQTKPCVPNLSWLTTVAASASLLWLAIGIVFPSAIGPDYSNIRATIILSNLGGALLAGAFSIAWKPTRQVWTALASIMLVIIWTFILAIQAVV
jgi:hypothetical protein